MTIVAYDFAVNRIATIEGEVAAEGPPPATEGTTRFYGYEFYGDIPTLPLTGDPAAARAAFLANLTGYAVEDFESFSAADNNPTLTFGGANSVTTQNIDLTVGTAVGRYNTTPGGSKHASLEYLLGAGFVPCNPFAGPFFYQPGEFNFSTPIAAFGAYFTDVGDWQSIAQMTIYTTAGNQYSIELGAPMENQNVGKGQFFGFILKDEAITRIRVFANWNHSTDYSSAFEQPDIFGIDDIIIATSAQIAQVNQGYPLPYITNALEDTGITLPSLFPIHEVPIKLTFEEVFDGNKFRNFGWMGDEACLRSPLPIEFAVDSVSNSVAAGHVTADAKYWSQAYRSVNGNYLTLANLIPAVGNTIWPRMSPNAGQHLATLEFWFKRTGSAVGNGTLFSWPGRMRFGVDGSNLLTAAFTGMGGGASVLNFTASGGALGTSAFAHVRFMWQQGNSSGSFARFAIFVDGVVVCDTERSPYFGGVFTALPPEGGDEMYLGSDAAGGYCPGIIAGFRFAAVCTGGFEAFTPPTGKYPELGTPGFILATDN